MHVFVHCESTYAFFLQSTMHAFVHGKVPMPFLQSTFHICLVSSCDWYSAHALGTGEARADSTLHLSPAARPCRYRHHRHYSHCCHHRTPYHSHHDLPLLTPAAPYRTAGAPLEPRSSTADAAAVQCQRYNYQDYLRKRLGRSSAAVTGSATRHLRHRSRTRDRPRGR